MLIATMFMTNKDLEDESSTQVISKVTHTIMKA